MGIKKNFAYNSTLQLLQIAIPVVTVPYVTRALGAAAYGEYSYTYAISNWFLILAGLGINNYGNRRIAACVAKGASLSSEFWSIFWLQASASAVAILLYLPVPLLLPPDLRVLSWVWLIGLSSCALDVSWFFFGLEQFRLTVTRSVLVKAAGLVAVLVFVRTPDDLPTYALVTGLTLVVSQAAVWPFIWRFVRFRRPGIRSSLAHLRPSLVLFLPIVAVSIYTIANKVILGFLSGPQEAGYFDVADRVVRMPLALVNSLAMVMLPRMSAVNASGDHSLADRYVRYSLSLVVLAGLGMMFGLSVTAHDVAMVFLGPGFGEVGLVLEILAPMLFGMAIGGVIQMQVLVPRCMDRAYAGSLAAGAIVSVCLNLALIPAYGASGAAISALLAEVVVIGVQVLQTRRLVSYGSLARGAAPHVLAGAVMWLALKILQPLLGSGWSRLALEVAGGALLYLIVCALAAFVGRRFGRGTSRHELNALHGTSRLFALLGVRP